MLSPQAQEVIEYLKQNLTVSVNVDNTCSKVRVTVDVSIGNDEIASSSDYFMLPDPNNTYDD